MTSLSIRISDAGDAHAALPRMDAARALYLSLGFRPIGRYNDYPIEGVLFFELTL